MRFGNSFKYARVALAATLAISLTLLEAPAFAATVSETSGYDIAEPQCASEGSTATIDLPASKAFAIIGVNGGLVFSENSCLNAQIDWAGSSIEFYANTGNRGPTSPIWPVGQTNPKFCSETKPDSANCAFDYGYNAAKHSYLLAETAYVELGKTGKPSDRRWWLDVETANSWRPFDGETLTDEFANSMNIANLKGAVYYLEYIKKVKQVGFYGDPNSWTEITGDTLAFSAHPFWFPIGASDEASADAQCSEQPGLTGSPSLYVQYIDADLDLDVNVPCSGFTKSETKLTSNTSATAIKSKYVTLKATLKTYNGAVVVNQKVRFRFAGNSYYAKTNASGIASTKVRVPSTVKTHSIKVSYAGNNILQSASGSDSLKVLAR